jgi:hypothetical protein
VDRTGVGANAASHGVTFPETDRANLRASRALRRQVPGVVAQAE